MTVLSCVVYGTRTFVGKVIFKEENQHVKSQGSENYALWHSEKLQCRDYFYFSPLPAYIGTRHMSSFFIILTILFVDTFRLRISSSLCFSPFPFPCSSWASIVSRHLPHSKETVSFLPLPLHPAGAVVVIQAPSALLPCFCYTKPTPLPLLFVSHLP